MLNDTACFPPKSIDNRADAASIIVEETLRIDVSRTEYGDVDRTPEGTEQVKGSIGAVVGQWIVILKKVPNVRNEALPAAQTMGRFL